jgi:hypothetical protein
MFTLEDLKTVSITDAPTSFPETYPPVVTLAATDGPNRPAHESGVRFVPRVPAAPAAVPERCDFVTRAALEPVMTEAQLLEQCAIGAQWQVADGVNLEGGCALARHAFPFARRQAVVAANWVHVSHTVPKKSWVLQLTKAELAFGSIFFGSTEASRFFESGRSVAFDVRGNFRSGASPQCLSVYSCSLDELSRGGINGFSHHGSFDGPPVCTVKLTIDLAAQTLAVELPKSQLVYPLTDWRSARVFVSFRQRGDAVKLKAA